MGTRCLTVVRDKQNSKDIIVLYRQFDGYPEGHGLELKDFLSPYSVVNGLSGDDKQQKVANGMGCLAAQLVCHFKNEPGGFYLHPSGTRDCGEEFIYTVYPEGSAINMRVQCGSVTFFGLPGTKQKNMPVIYDGPVHEFNPESANQAHEALAKQIPNDFAESKAKS